MQTLTRMNEVIIEDYYHMTTMDQNANWMKKTRLSSKKNYLYLRGPFSTLIFTSKFLTTSLNVHTRRRRKLYFSLMYTMYVNASINTPTYTHVTLYIVRRVHPLGLKLGVELLNFLRTNIWSC
jgi:hypothetical protein